MRDVQILGRAQLLDLQRRLRAAGDENLRRSMQRRVRRAAEPLRNDLQRTMRTLQIRSQGRRVPGGPSTNLRPLRETIAQSIKISVRNTGHAGARVWIDRSMLPRNMWNVPTQLDRGRLRHPVFGNRRRWVNQYADPWWSSTIRRHEARMAREIARVVDDVQRRLGA